MTNADYVTCVASFNSLFEPIVNCNTCLSRDLPDHQLEYDRKIKGCFKVRNDPIPLFTDVSGLKFYTCIGNLKQPNFHFIWSAFLQWDKHGGDIWNMPAKLVEIFQLLDNLKAEKAESDRKAAEQKTKSKARRNGR